MDLRIKLEIVIDAPSTAVWAELSDLRSHPEWMKDARSLDFIGETTSGVGTVMKVVTEVGPFRTTDVLEVTEWDEESHIRIRHIGVVKGDGILGIEPRGDGSVVVWDETIEFPWWLGGGLTALVARPVLARVWKGNLDRLAGRVSGP